MQDEQQYLDLLEKIVREGSDEVGRNGRTRSIFGHSMRFSLANHSIPIFTCKKTAWKTVLHELMWFVRGETDNGLLQAKGVHIWDGNSTREFLDSRGLYDRREGDLGPIYGFQWRRFNAPYTSCDTPADDKAGIDQLQYIIDQLSCPAGRHSRRLVMTAWNPCQLDEMALPPCHVMCQFRVTEGVRLSCAVTQRSCDCGLGVPFNVASYAFLTHLVAYHCGLEAHELVFFMGDCHIYEAHVEPLTEMLRRAAYDATPFPRVFLRPKTRRAKIEEYEVEDFVVEGYVSHPAVKLDMIA